MSVRYLNLAFKMPTNPIETLVLVALADYADDDGYCFPGYESLIDKTKVSKATLAKTLHILEGAGFFDKKAHSSIGQGRRVNTYTLLFSESWFETFDCKSSKSSSTKLIESIRLELIAKINALRDSKKQAISLSLSHRRVHTSDLVSLTPRHEPSFNHHKEPSLLKKVGFAIPTIEELVEYISEKNYGIDPESFHAHYSSNGWVVGKTKMKCWKSALVTWEKRSGQFKQNYGKAKQPAQRPDYSDYTPLDENFNNMPLINGERVS